jgi:hypothetical protein
MSIEMLSTEWVADNSPYVIIDNSDIVALIDMLKVLNFNMGIEDLNITYENLLKRINSVIAENYERKSLSEEEEN